MKRRLALLAGAAMLSTIAVIAPASPASATYTDVCAGQGTAGLSDTLTYPVTPTATPAPAKLANFTFTFTIGTCATKSSFSASGHVHGWCGQSTGSGVTGNGAQFHFISVGGTLVIFGHLVGIVNAIPQLGTSCLTGASSFLINGVVVLTPVLIIPLPPILWNEL